MLFLLSTSPSEAPDADVTEAGVHRTLHPMWLVAGWLVLVFALLQLAAIRFAGPTVKAAEERVAWLAGQQPADFLIMGDSTAHHLSAAALGAGAGGAALNGALRGGTAVSAAWELEHLVAWRPRAIVVGMLAPALLGDGRPSEPFEVEIESVAQRSWLRGGQGMLESVAPIYRLRSGLRMQLGAARRRLLGQPILSVPQLPEDDDGSLGVISLSRPTRADARAVLDRAVPGDTPTRGARLAALRALAQNAQQRGIDVAYVLMPLSAPMRAELGARGYADFGRAELDAVTARYGGRWLDCRAALPDEAFYDADHLRRGPHRESFSRCLGAFAAGQPQTCCPS